MIRNLIVGVDIQLKETYLVTVLYQYGIHFNFFNNIVDAVENNNIEVFIWGSDFNITKISKKIVVITDNFFLANILNLSNCERDSSEYFKIDSIFGLKVNGYFMIKNQIIKINGLHYEGKCFNKEGKELNNSGISKVEMGQITFISYPFNILNERIGMNQDYRFFYSSAIDDFYVEIGPTVDYGFLKKLCFYIFIYAFNSIGLPLVQLKNIQHEKKYYTIRIDADGFKQESILKTLNLASESNKSFNWYIDLYSWAKYKGLELLNVLRSNNQNVQLHSFRHMTYKNFLNNYLNMLTGKLILKYFGLHNNAIVSPFGFYNFNFQNVVNKLKYIYSSEFGFNVNDKASFPNNDFKSAIQLPSNNASITTLGISLFNDEEKFIHLFESTVSLSNENGFTILYEHPLHGIDKYYNQYLDLINKLDEELEYIAIEDYVKLIKEYYLEAINKQELYINDIDWNRYNYFNIYDQSIKFEQNHSINYNLSFFIPYHMITNKINILEERQKFYKDNFKSERESNFLVFIIKYFFKSVLVSIINYFRK